MATTSQVIINGQSIAAPSGEKEIRLGDGLTGVTKVGFIVTSGTMQVTTARRGTQDAIDGRVAAFANTNYPIYMTVEPAKGSETEGRNIFIKGSGTIVFFF